MKLGAYIHIPYCLQRCSYCDFVTFEQSKILPPEDYVAILCQEIKQKSFFFPKQELHSIYFGGGTPSLLKPSLIIKILETLSNFGFTFGVNTEMTLEVNPATLSRENLNTYLSSGINRFSVGAQTFHNGFLKNLGREHSQEDTLTTLSLLQESSANYTFDILFGLPHQSLENLKSDMKIVKNFSPQHLSAYCLTLPEKHPLSEGRPPEGEQIEMFHCVEENLFEGGYERYEISNFCKPGFESKHNLLYWTDEPWMAFGVSAHGYSSKSNDWGIRYWNSPSLKEYLEEVHSQGSLPFLNLENYIKEGRGEILQKRQSLTDDCHTSLRLVKGLHLNRILLKYGPNVVSQVLKRLQYLASLGWVQEASPNTWSLSREGLLISNQVFEYLTFLEGEI